MQVPETVNGSGWISEESSFMGDDETQSKWEEKAQRSLKRPRNDPLFAIAASNKKRKCEAQTDPAPKADVLATAASTKKVKREAQPEPTRKEDALSITASSHKIKLEAQPEDALAFLRSRPQVAALQQAAVKDRKPFAKQSAHTAAGVAEEDLLEEKYLDRAPSTWQQHETIDTFLKRAPVLAPSTANLGPWLWVYSPKISWSQKKQREKTDIATFKNSGAALLQRFDIQKQKVKAANPDAAQGTITRQMRPYREQLEDNLLALAVKTGTTCGKWMLFPTVDDYPRYWRLVAEHTAAGKFGPTSKAATYDPVDPLALICVYTYDFTDNEDVRRVLEELVELGLCRKPIFYKCDAYTYLHISSENPYKIKASLYSSKEILGNEAKAKKDGPIDRLKKRNRTMDSFFSS